MKLLDMRIDYMEGYANASRLQLLVDEIPDMTDAIYTHHNGLYCAHKEGLVRFFFYRGPGRGYAGRVFKIRVAQGRTPLEQQVARHAGQYYEKDLVGPWSSNSGVINYHAHMLTTPCCMGASITDSHEVWARGHTFIGCHVTIGWLRPHLRTHPELRMIRVDEEQSITYNLIKVGCLSKDATITILPNV